MIGKYLTQCQSAIWYLSILAAGIAVSFGLPWETVRVRTLPATLKPARISVVEQEDGILFSENGQAILFYQVRAKSMDGQFERANYVHPLYDLKGNIITEDFPDDHPHQRGIFWAWHQLRVGDKAAGDSWLTSDFSYNVVQATTNESDDNGSASVTARVQWLSPLITGPDDKPFPIVNETTTITVYPQHGAQNEDTGAQNGDTRKIDFEIKLVAAVDDVAIGGSDDDKGYGGFSCRFVLPDDAVFQAASGVVTPIREAIDAGSWIDLQGRFGSDQQTGGIVILIHPSSAGYPQRWILRAKNSMQNPVFPGRTPFGLSTGLATVLRYRLILHQGDVDAGQLRIWQEDYSKHIFQE